MNLYLISQNKESGWDTFDSAVVAATTEQTAMETHPQGIWGSGNSRWDSSSWCSDRKYVAVEYLGEAKPVTEAGVICASFNAG